MTDTGGGLPGCPLLFTATAGLHRGLSGAHAHSHPTSSKPHTMTHLRGLLVTGLMFLASAPLSRADLIITEVVDGTLAGGQPKWVELTNTGSVTVLLGGFSLGVKNNGSTNLGGAATVLAGTLPAGSSHVIAFETDNGPGVSMFFTVYGQDPDAYSTASINGDDTVLLYLGAATGDGSNATLVDLYGEDGVDGSATVWEYEDSFAQRCGDTANAGVFASADWDIPGPNALETGCGGDDTCETANLQVLTNPWIHAGCSTSGPGASYCIGDQGACPCGNDNNGINGPAGCANGSSAGGASLKTSGSSSLSAADLVLQSAGLPPLQTALYFQGNNAINGGAGLSFGEGLRCAGGAAVRLQTVFTDGSGASTTTIDIGAKGGVAPGDTKRYQLWYPDPVGAGCGGGFNLSNGSEIAWSA